MSDELKFPNLPKLLEGFKNDEAVEFVNSVLNEQAVAEYRAKKQASAVENLQKEYLRELSEIKVGVQTAPYQKLKQREAIRAKYRAKGLEV